MAEKVTHSEHDSHRPSLSCKLVQKKLEYRRRRHCPYRHINVSSLTISMVSPERAIGSPMLQVRGASAEGSHRGKLPLSGARNLPEPHCGIGK
jgi:hypothetical protein